MRMKLNSTGQLALAAAVSLLAAGALTACGTLTVDFVYVTSSKAAGVNNYGNVDVFEVNSESGRLRKIPTSPFPSGGRNPVAEAVGTNFANLYVVNQDDNNIVQFAIGTDGKLYPQNTVNTPGIFPLALAINSSLLYVADTYQPLPTCSPAEPCPGSVGVFPLSSSGQPGTPVANGDIDYWPLIAPCSPANVITPSAINVLKSGKFVFVTAYDTTAEANNTSGAPVANGCDTSGPGTAPTGYIFAFAAGSSGALAAVKGSPFVVKQNGTSGIGVDPSAVASDPNNVYVWITDFANAQVYGYAISPSGAPIELAGRPFASGNQPASITTDSSGAYAYVANSLDNTITAYTVSGGALSPFGTYPVSAQPVAVLVDPATDHFVYAANYLGSSVSGYQLIPGDAPSLVVNQQSPYAGDPQMTAMAAIPHGTQPAQ
jgi:6-phosphogluconolactonase